MGTALILSTFSVGNTNAEHSPSDSIAPLGAASLLSRMPMFPCPATVW